jgi:hypothetical protein
MGALIYQETTTLQIFNFKRMNIFYQAYYVSKPCVSFGFHNFDNI